MLRSSFLAALILTVAGGQPARGQARDQKQLQGRWRLTAVADSEGLAQREGFVKYTLVIKGNQMAREFKGRKAEKGQPFKLDPAKNPRQIDFKTRTGHKEWQDRVGIYALDGDKLRICFSTVVPVKESLRPTDFTIKPGSGRVLLVFERVKP
jgi:uncharacterized protein (TIGR03067 family)